MLAAYIIAARNRHRADKLAFVQKALMPVVYILVLIMGLRMGVNEQVTSNLGTIGVQSLIITVFAVAGSMIFITGVRKIMGMDKYGNLKTKAGSKADAEEDKAIECASNDEEKLSKAVMIGDRMDTDVISGMESGMSTVLVLSGVSDINTVDSYAYRPTVVLGGVGDIVAMASSK